MLLVFMLHFFKADPCCYFNPLNAELHPICHLLALLGGATIVVVSRLRVKKENGRNSTHLRLKNWIIIPQFLSRRCMVSARNRASLTKPRNHVAFFKVYRLYVLMVSYI